MSIKKFLISLPVFVLSFLHQLNPKVPNVCSLMFAFPRQNYNIIKKFVEHQTKMLNPYPHYNMS